MNIICISNNSRPDLLAQTLTSLRGNAKDYTKHTVTLVLDDPGEIPDEARFANIFIAIASRTGASAARNIGAGSVFPRQEHVMFVDDDIYAVPGWDEMLECRLSALRGNIVLSGHAHPFNHHVRYMSTARCHEANVLSTVHMVMPWSIWDDVGHWTLPGGPGGSEDVDWCRRATGKGYSFAVTDPQCIIHCGLRSSSGSPIVGHGLMLEQNTNLIRHYGLDGKVIMAL